MKKLTKRILTGLTAASIVSVAVLPTSTMAIGHDFNLQLQTTITQPIVTGALFGNEVVVAADPTAIIDLGSANPGTINSREIEHDFIQNTSGTAHHLDITIDGDSRLKRDGSNDYIDVTFAIEGTDLSSASPINDLEIPANGTFSLTLKEIDTSATVPGDYRGNLVIRVSEH